MTPKGNYRTHYTRSGVAQELSGFAQNGGLIAARHAHARGGGAQALELDLDALVRLSGLEYLAPAAHFERLDPHAHPGERRDHGGLDARHRRVEGSRARRFDAERSAAGKQDQGEERKDAHGRRSSTSGARMAMKKTVAVARRLESRHSLPL